MKEIPIPLDHPLGREDSPESLEYRKAFEDLKAALEKFDVCGLALVAVVPYQDKFFTLSSVANKVPVSRHILLSSVMQEMTRWHDRMEKTQRKSNAPH